MRTTTPAVSVATVAFLFATALSAAAQPVGPPQLPRAGAGAAAAFILILAAIFGGD